MPERNQKGGRTITEETKAAKDILYLSGCAIHGICPRRSRLEQMDMETLYRMSRSHSMTNLVFEAVLSACGGELPDTPILKQWREARDKAVTKNLLLDAERAALFAWMEQAGIWYLPLKGSILKNYYPKSGMRQMADNDILFDTAYQEQVRDWFVSRGYKIKSYKQSVHDAYLKAPIYNFEMHTALFSDAFKPEQKVWVDYYKDVKKRLLPDEDRRYGYHFTDEDFYLYFITHSCKHYRHSGTGLRTLLDFYVYLSAKGGSLDWDYIRAELPKLELADYERQTRELAKKVFADPEGFSMEQLSRTEWQMLGYYLSSGTYGTNEQRVKNKLSKLANTKGSIGRRAKLQYLWGRLFPSQTFMKSWCRMNAPFFLRHTRLMPLAVAWRTLSKGVTHTRKWKREVSLVAKTEKIDKYQ